MQYECESSRDCTLFLQNGGGVGSCIVFQPYNCICDAMLSSIVQNNWLEYLLVLYTVIVTMHIAIVYAWIDNLLALEES